MSLSDPPIEPMRVVSLKSVWDSWTLFDVVGDWVWGEEAPSPHRYGTSCRVCVTDSSMAAAGQMFERRSRTKSLECVTTLFGIRMERVARIRAAIANGSYTVSSADVAQKLMSNMQGNCR